jgi:hypothetical protein
MMPNPEVRGNIADDGVVCGQLPDRFDRLFGNGDKAICPVEFKEQLGTVRILAWQATNP